MRIASFLSQARSLFTIAGTIFVATLISSPTALAANLTKCGKHASVRVEPGKNSYTVHNNIWNGSNKSQCIEVDSFSGEFKVVSTAHDRSAQGAPASYAFINKGCHWGVCSNAEGEMPRQVGTILDARSSWNTTQTANGVYNVAYDIWFHSSSMTFGHPDSAELMIWLAYKGDIQPTGSLIEEAVSIDNSTWNIWAGWNGKNIVITYVRTDNIEVVNDLNIKSFIADSTSREFIDQNWYLISVGAGFEIWKGGVGLASNSFDFKITGLPPAEAVDPEQQTAAD